MRHAFEKLDKLESIPGFKVMEWLRKVRDESYELQKNDPEAYATRMRRINKEMGQQYGKSISKPIYSDNIHL